MVGLNRFELSTSRLSGVRSNQLSYRPISKAFLRESLSLKTKQNLYLCFFLLRKEVIHPHVPVGIPCYDFTPIICPTLDGSLLFYRLGHRLRVLQTLMV